MKFYSRKAPRMKTDTLMDQISTGQCDDLVVSELKVAISELTDPSEKELILTALKDIALKSDNPASVAASIKSLIAFPPMEMGLEGTLEIRILELITNKVAFSNRALQEAIAEFLYMRVSERVERAEPFVDVLIQFLDDGMGTAGTVAYNTLIIVAANQPEYFQQHGGLLIKMLGSINKATRVQTTRLIAVLAMSHPEYVAGAENNLVQLSSFYPDAELKNSASEALQVLSSRLRPDEPTPIDDMQRRRQEPEQTGGLADIMRRRMGKDKKVSYESRIDKRLLSMATNFARKADRAYYIDGEMSGPEDTEAINKIMDDFSDIAQSIRAEAAPMARVEMAEASSAGQDMQEEIELRRMMEKVKDDFSINAGNILDALGMGHLATKAPTEDARSWPAETSVRDRPKRVRLTRTEPVRHEHVPEKPVAKMAVEEEDVNPKEFIASIESIISRTEKEHPEMALPMHAAVAAGMPASMMADGSGTMMGENPVASSYPAPETIAPEPAAPDMTAFPVAPQEISKPDTPVEVRPIKSPIVPSGVRISAMKFKSVDQSKMKKTPTPPKISIKPHIKPLNKPPIDVTKIAPTRHHPMINTPLAPRALVPKVEASPGEIICHTCNGKMPEDSQRCAICGADLKSPKVRCRKCGEINLRGAGKCNRCGSDMDE